ncbi:MAG: DUF1549 and DUF1553 domain-containing protein, partial [Gemmataceae bacterium]|nr:DUF1549 and DUF1553 domain-containing protein [Gemmataceae bacterium]
WVIDAFNADLPFDRFVIAQIAGDLLPASSPTERDRQLIATGFLAVGPRDVNQRFQVRFVMDNIDEQIDAVTRAFLALTVSCARCHDHKFDPIPTSDYYALAGIFHSTDLCAGVRNKMGGSGLDYYDTAKLLPLSLAPGEAAQRRSAPQAEVEQARLALKQARAELLALMENVEQNPAGPGREKKLAAARKKVNEAQAALVALEDPAAYGPVAMGVRDGNTIGDTEIRIRGEAEQLGPTVPRGFLTVFDVPGAAAINPKQSGRLELAQWLVHRNNPMTARVFVNRVWHHLLGRGIVPSVDNFGLTGEPPSHPELLDHLARRFMDDGWSIKKLIRNLVLTRAYQLSSEAVPANVAVDPANRLVWRHTPRRLSAEEIRDAMLAAAGKLQVARPHGSPGMDLKVVELPNNGPVAKKLEEAALRSTQRSIYLPLLRTLTPRPLEIFDFAEQGFVVGQRDATTVATQALYLLNDPFVRQQADGLADRAVGSSLDDGERIAAAYRLALGRPATEKEVERAAAFLADYQAAVGGPAGSEVPARRSAWVSLCQALLASAEFRYIR